MDLRRGVTEIQRRIQLKELELSHIPADQTRIRENMKVVDKSTDYYNDLLKKLRAQETQLETVNKELTQLRADLETQQKKLDDYLKDLTI
jgi:chromosome segregation ATPase